MEPITLDLAATLDFINLRIDLPDRPARVHIYLIDHMTRLCYYDIDKSKPDCGFIVEILPKYYSQVCDILRAFEQRCGLASTERDFENYIMILPACVLSKIYNHKPIHRLIIRSHLNKKDDELFTGRIPLN